MPVTFDIRENGYVAYYVLSDPWQTADLTSLYHKDLAFRDTVNHQVHTFMDVTNVHRIPPNIMRAREHAPAFIHRNSGQLIMTGAHMFPKTIAEMIFRLARYERAKFFETEAEGWDYVRTLMSTAVPVLDHAA